MDWAPLGRGVFLLLSAQKAVQIAMVLSVLLVIAGVLLFRSGVIAGLAGGLTLAQMRTVVSVTVNKPKCATQVAAAAKAFPELMDRYHLRDQNLGLIPLDFTTGAAIVISANAKVEKGVEIANGISATVSALTFDGCPQFFVESADRFRSHLSDVSTTLSAHPHLTSEDAENVSKLLDFTSGDTSALKASSTEANVWFRKLKLQLLETGQAFNNTVPLIVSLR
jgi:hypothetical protein